MDLRSTAFATGGAIPAKHTCEDGDASPPLAWAGIPPAAQSLALIVDDPDAPDPAAPKMTWVHWVVYDLPPDPGGLPEGVKVLPAGAQAGGNDFRRTSYGGPCPPVGRHRYFFKLYALDVVIGQVGLDKKGLEAAMKGHVVGQAELIGTYAKKP